MAIFIKYGGDKTNGDDPQRYLWYAAGPGCGYWTDDWDKLGSLNGIPCCPKCSMAGMQTTADDWFGGAEKHESDNHPHYLEFLVQSKETCLGGGMSFMDAYEVWLENEKGVDDGT